MPNQEFREIADRVLVARHRWLDVTVTAVLGSRGIVLVDTLGSVSEAEAMLARLHGVSDLPVVAVVNTHAHYDHVLGNAAVSARHPGVELLAHEDAVAEMAPARQAALASPEDHGIEPDRYDEVEASPLLTPTRTFSSVSVVDLGDRELELVFCGRGHTAGDLVVRVPDAEVLLAGDLVEQSGPPSYGADCWPLEWPITLETASQLTTPATVVVPGHGDVVDHEFLHEQRRQTAQVAETVHELVGRGVPVAQALAEGEWPFPADSLTHAVRRGYEHIDPSARRLPMA